jgi:hypothetical protein
MKITSMGIDLAKPCCRCMESMPMAMLGCGKMADSGPSCGHRAVHAQGVETRKQGHSPRTRAIVMNDSSAGDSNAAASVRANAGVYRSFNR